MRLVLAVLFERVKFPSCVDGRMIKQDLALTTLLSYLTLASQKG